MKGEVDYRKIKYEKKKVIMIMGNEKKGMKESIEGEWEKIERIKKEGRED